MDENYVSKEVHALIERMEQFPHEFVEDGPWCHTMRKLLDDCGELPFLLTTEEERVLKEAYRRLLRAWFSEVVVTRIINPGQERQQDLFAAWHIGADTSLNESEIRAMQRRLEKPRKWNL